MKASIVKRAVLGSIVASALSGGGWYAWHWYQANRYLEKTDDAYVAADVVDIRPEVTGRIDQVLAKENQRVRRGQVLVRINPADFRARVEQAQARLAVARAAVEDASEQISLQQRKIQQAEAGVDAGKAQVRRAGLELRRARDLAKKSFVSRQSLQNNEAEDSVARARLLENKANLAAARQMREVLTAKEKSARAEVESAEAALDYATQQLAKTTIAAPRDGVVGDLGAREGAMAQPSLTLMRLVPVPQVYVRANFKETQIARMSIGEPAAIHVDALPGVVFHGEVSSLAPATGTEFSLLPQDNATGNFNKIVQRVPVRIRVTGPIDAMARLRPGLSVVPEVDTRRFDARRQLSYLDSEPAISVARSTPVTP
ncbi:MAG: HlyD family secretion protein [Arenicellales bacterium]